MTATEKKNERSFKYKRTKKEQVRDFFYETSRKLFWKNGKNPSTNMSIKRGNQIFIIAMLILPIISWGVFWLYTNIQSIFMAFEHPVTGELSFINFKNVWGLVTKTDNSTYSLSVSIINTLKYFGVMMFVNTPICLIIAYFFYKRIMWYKAFRVIFYLPAIISSVVYVTAFQEFINPIGPLGMIQKWFGLTPDPVSLLARNETATNTILLYCVYTGMTTNVLLFSSGMARIPIEVLEAAKLDGVGPARELTQLIFPLIWPTFSTQMVFMLTGVFSSSGPILLFTNGAYDTSTISYWIFRQLYGSDGNGGGEGAYSLVACVGLCFTMLGVPLILLVRKIVERIDPIEY